MKARRIFLGMVLALGVPATTFGQAADSPVVEARRQLTEAQTAVTNAKLAMERARVRVAATFKAQNPDYAKAEADAAKAKAEIEATRQAAITAVRAKPEFIAAEKGREEARTKLQQLQQTGGNQAEMNALSEKSVQHAATISQMQRAAVENDAKYNDAVARLAEANRVIEGFKSQIDEFCAADPEYITLVDQHTQAQQAIVTAEDGMKQAAMAQREQAAAAARAKAEERKSKSKSNN